MAVRKVIDQGLDGSAVKVLIQQFNALLAKLDADVGVTDTDYASTLKVQDALTGQDI